MAQALEKNPLCEEANEERESERERARASDLVRVEKESGKTHTHTIFEVSGPKDNLLLKVA